MSRPLRADARRNRDRLVEVALEAFSKGPDATLESIAKTAGVGIGTLYRHFPTREALIEAVYRTELAKLCDSVPDLLATRPPDEALRTWMDRFVDYMAAKRGMADALKVVIASGGDPYSQSLDLLTNAVTTLLEAAGISGVDPVDVLGTISGISLVAADMGGQGGRMLDLLMDGLRHRR